MVYYYNKVLSVLLVLLVGAAWGQEEGVCECGHIAQAHEKCVQDWSALDAIRVTLEQQVRDTQSQCNGQLEQVRGEVEQARNEGNRQLELARSESQAQLEQVQAQHRELSAQFEEQGNTHRRLQEASQQLEEALASVKAEKTNLENSVREKEAALNDLKRQKSATERDLEATKKTLDEMVAARAIISIDWELLNEKIEEIKAKIAEATKDLTALCAEKLEFAKVKALEFYDYLKTEVYPKVKKTVEEDVIPFVKKSWKQANEMWEDIYSPYRPTVNKNLELAKVESKKFYQQKLEPHVKAYELDVHAAKAKKQAQEYMTYAHNELVNGIKTGTKTALVYVKTQEGNVYSHLAVEHLEHLHAQHELVAYYIECFFAFLVVYFLLKITIFRPKKKVKKSAKKQQWKEKEAAAAAAKQQQGSGKKAAKNGYKSNKKNK